MVPTVSIAGNPSAAREIAESLTQSGFAVISNHGIEPAMFDELYASWATFFADDARFSFDVDTATQNGFFGMAQAETAKGATHQDIKEYFQYRPGAKVPAAQADITAAFYDAMFDLAHQVLTWLQAETDATLWQTLEQPLASYLSKAHTMCRILHYPALTGNETEGAIRAGAHEDINFITLLPAATASGLEIKPGDSDWLPVSAAPGSIVINIGDMMQELTRGALPSTTHRVVNPDAADNTARITAPVFCHPVESLRLSARHTAGSYLNERLTEINPEALRPS